MYAICNVVYGWDLTEHAQTDDTLSDTIAELVDNDDEHVIALYSGNGPTPYAVGVILCQFDETENIPVKKLVLSPTEKQKKDVAKNVPPELKDYIDGEPTAFLMWSSS
jgi:hypothetical protein